MSKRYNKKIEKLKRKKIIYTKDIAKFREDIKYLSLVDTMKYIENNNNLDLAEITFGIRVADKKVDKIREEIDYIKEIENKSGLKMVELHAINRVVIDYKNTLRDLIEILENTIDINDFEILGWNVVDIKAKLIYVFGDSFSDTPISNFIQNQKIKKEGE